ncbi:MAG: FAD-binding oxidoreductase [Pseudomonadota bacterium]
MAALSRALDAHTIVIGAGVIGAACAFRLAQTGREVLLLNADPPEGAASFGNAGHIATEQLFPLASGEVLRKSWSYLRDPDSPLRLRMGHLLPLMPWLARFVWAARKPAYARGVEAILALQRSALADMADLLRDAGLADLLHQRGHLEVWETEAGGNTAITHAERLKAFGVESQQWSADAVRAQVPLLTPGVQGAVHYLGSGHVDDPWAVCQGLREAMSRSRGQMYQGRAVRLLADPQQGATVVLEDGSQLRSEQLLVCAGAWSKPLAASLGYRVPLDTERGYHITVGGPSASQTDGPPTLLQPVASTERKVIMTSMSMGLRMTGTVELGGLHLLPDPRRYQLLRRQLQALLPGVDTTDMRSWMGFRPSLPDHLPVMGVAPRHNNVFFAFGHQHLGLTLAGVTAAVMAELMQVCSSPIDLAPYAVDRFRFA